MTLTDEQLEILRHAVGNDGRRGRQAPGWRNHYCAANGSPDMEALVDLGAMRRGAVINDGDARYYHVTEAAMPIACAPIPPRDGLRRFVVELVGWDEPWSRTYDARTRSAAKYQAANYLQDGSGRTVFEIMRMLRARLA